MVAAGPADKPYLVPVVKALRASRDGVVASQRGVECFSTVASDSPTRVLNLRAIWLRVVQDILSLGRLGLLLIEDITGIAGSSLASPAHTGFQGL